MKSILMSIQPKWVAKILNGEKTIEVRKTAPKEVPFKVYIYCTYGRGKGASALYFDAYGNVSRKANGVKWINGKVIGEFICNTVENIPVDSEAFTAISKPACLTIDELIEYCSGKDMYALHISDLKVYDKPKELSDFYSIKQCKPWTWEEPLARPPQSWQYIQELEEYDENN